MPKTRRTSTVPHPSGPQTSVATIPVSQNQITGNPQDDSSFQADVAAASAMNSQDSSAVEGAASGDDSETNEDESENEDMSSDVSEGGDLQEDLQDALDDSNFSFHGTYYHGSLLVNPPNPCLFISGLGLVGLPLSERDAKAIVACSTLAPFGKGERTVVDKEVRDTWEIEPSRISFGNPIWLEYVNKTLCAQLCASLGVTLGSNPPKMELYKLLLYETGSHFLPHQDTQKADGMFATAIVVLPSAYTGGQVILSHASNTKTIDFPQNSLLSMALLAWYTDVKHEVKPVTSGYRLALSYNLIHVAPAGIPPPCLPDMRDSTQQLERVLKKWRNGKYNEETPRNLVAYLLNHEYSAVNLGVGLKALKGVDLHRVSFMRTIAEESGFRVGLARLEHNESGAAEDSGCGYGRSRFRDCYYDDSEDDETPEMMEVESTTTTISGLVDLDGSVMLSVGKIDIEADCLIPNDPFEGAAPDDTDYEGYQGNYAGQVDHWYRRTVVFLMRDDGVDDICYLAEGPPYAFRMLKKSTTIPPTPEDVCWADRLLGSRSLTKEYMLTLVDFSLKWKKLEMWKTIADNPSCTLAALDPNILINTMVLFSFDAVRLSFETLLARSTVLSEKIDFITKLPPKAAINEKDAVNSWYQREVIKILSSYSSANVKDIPTILYIIRLFGLKVFQQIVMTNLKKKKDNFTFLVAFVKALCENRQSIVEREASFQLQLPSHPASGASSTPLPTADAAVSNLVKECLQAAVLQWNINNTQYSGYSYYQPAYYTATSKIDRIIEIIEQSIATSELDISKALFIEILKSPGTTLKKFQELYTPLIPRLRGVLTAKSRNLSQPPFVDFIQLVIGLYLRDILGKKGQLSNLNLRKIGCGCGDCKMLDDFIMDYNRNTAVIRIVQARRLHLERQASAARDLCTFQTIRSGSPHGIQLTKLPAVVEASTWISRQRAAKAFLTSIGSESEISCIMGNRYADVKYAIDGARPFGSVPTMAPSAAATTTGAARTTPSTTLLNSARNHAQNQIRPVTNSHPLASSSHHGSARSVPVPAAIAPPTQLAGTKRKSEPKVHLGTIDLTGEGSY